MAPGLTVVSFFTQEWEYPEHAARLREECRAFRLPCRIRELPSTGEYLANTRLKPSFVLDCLVTMQTPVLWLDADASLLKLPTAVTGHYDFMAHPMAASRDRMWHVGVLFFNFTPASVDLCRRWVDHTRKGSDEAGMELAWRSAMSETLWHGTWGGLPDTYYDVLNGAHKTPYDDTVVAHRLSRSASKRALKERAKP
jgi:hypothetical protein